MKTYLVRTKSDQVLMGVFCAASPADLAKIIDTVFDARECEYLELRPNEGLFVEGQFVTAVTGDEGEQVLLTHVDDPLISPSSDEDADDELLAFPDVDLFEADEEEDIPPLLEPTEALHARLQQAKNEWQPLQLDTKPLEPVEVYLARLDPEVIAKKLIRGALNPASFVRPPSSRLH